MSVVGYAIWGTPERKVAITDDDLLWAARGTVGETDSDPESWALVAWTVLSRLVVFADRGRTVMPCRDGVERPMTLASMWLCFSQPINPYWRNRGTPEEIRRRNAFAVMTWADIERRRPGLKAWYYRWARGEIANPCVRCADFSATRLVTNPIVVKGGNGFIAEGASANWPATGYIRIVAAKSSRGFGFRHFALGVLAAGGAGWLTWWLARGR